MAYVNHTSIGRSRDFTGQKIGKLLVIQKAGRANKPKDNQALWHCVCDCGKAAVVPRHVLTHGRHPGCPSCTSEAVSAARRRNKLIHGHYFHPLFNIWKGMHLRCSMKAPAKTRRLYFDRGITVCDRWKSFEAFVEDMGDRPSKGHSIERIDNNGAYSKDNCRWATQREQCRNTRRNRYIHWHGETMILADWAARLGLNERMLRSRFQLGWPVDDLFGIPRLKRGVHRKHLSR